MQPRDKCFQTKQDISINTKPYNTFLWGLRGKMGNGQHSMLLSEEFDTEKMKGKSIVRSTSCGLSEVTLDFCALCTLENNQSKNYPKMKYAQLASGRLHAVSRI